MFFHGRSWTIGYLCIELEGIRVREDTLAWTCVYVCLCVRQFVCLSRNYAYLARLECILQVPIFI